MSDLPLIKTTRIITYEGRTYRQTAEQYYRIREALLKIQDLNDSLRLSLGENPVRYKK